MKLNDLDKKNAPVKALKEHFSMDFNVSNLDRSQTKKMLGKVQKLISETKKSHNYHGSEKNPAYLKLMFMEQALTKHLSVAKSPRIIYENEEVEKSQVILAAQDMIDTVQKMYEDVNDMLVKELPALVDSIQSEIGANESTSFNQAANQALTTLNASLQEAQTSLKGALGTLTGQGGVDAFAQDEPEMADDIGSELGADLDSEDDLDLPPIPDMEDEEELSMSAAGRPRR
jgi:hypothetical protein